MSRVLVAAFILLGFSPAAGQGMAPGPPSRGAAEYFRQADTLFKAGQYEAAAKSLRAALRQRPGWAEAYHSLCVVEASAGRHAEAVEDCRQAIRLRPEASAYIHLGEALGKLGRLRKAAAAFKRATLLRPDSAAARYNLGLVSLDLRWKAEALAQHRKLSELDPALARKLYREIFKDKLLDAGRGAGPR